MSSADRIRFIINPVSAARHAGIEQALQNEAGRLGLQFDTAISTHPGNAVTLAKRAADSGVDIVVAVGGDGTVHEVANGLIGSGSALAIVPVGTGNALARTLKIPMDVLGACSLLRSPHTITMDVGRVGDRHFVTTMGVGLDAEVSRRFSGTEPRRRGFGRYAWLTVRSLWAYDPVELALELDGGETVTCRPILVAVANTGQYGHGATIAPGAAHDDGLLDLCIVDGVTPFKVACNAYRLFTGSIDRMSGYRSMRTAGIRIRRDIPGGYQVDGEYLEGGDTLCVKAVPRALRVVVSPGD